MGPCPSNSRNIATTLPSSSDGGSYFFEANSRYQSLMNEAILMSRTADRSILFRASNDSIRSILRYLSIESICQLDVAVTNTAARVVWMSSLQLSNYNTISERQHCKSSIRWLVTRGIRLESLKISNGQWFKRRLNGSAFLGLNVSLLRNLSFRDCNIGDEEVISLAHDCPYLSEICLYDCQRISDASIVGLANWCVHLIAIDIGKCMNITDDGLVAFASDCSNVRTANVLDGVDICNLKTISFHDCTKISDKGVSADL